jgi:predicted HicB family RNase H-like nuclease
MANKAVSSRPAIPQASSPTESEFAALINAGGSSAVSEAEKKELARQKRQAKKLTEPTVNVRIPVHLLTRLDALRTKRTGKISRNTWILEAIEDKIEREQEIGE